MAGIIFVFIVLTVIVGIPAAIAAITMFLVKIANKGKQVVQFAGTEYTSQFHEAASEESSSTEGSSEEEEEEISTEEEFSEAEEDHTEENVQQNAPQNVQVNFQPKKVKVSKPKTKLSASAVMLLIGTIFIVLSAITFVAANWVKMEPAGRVFALAGASVLAFSICGVMKSALHLDGTSAAFYIIGSLVALTSVGTAGYYELFGEWFSITGDGWGLFLSFLAVIAAASAFAAQPIYKTNAFHYVGLSFISLAIIFICVQFSEEYSDFAVLIAFAQLIVTAVIHVIKPQKGSFIETPVRIIGDTAAVIYEVLALAYVLFTSFEPTWATFTVLAIILVQLFVYGIFKNQTWMFLFGNIFALYADFTAAQLIYEEYNSSAAMLTFSFITLAIYIINKFIPKNLEAARMIAFGGTVIGAIVSLAESNSDMFILNLIVPSFVTLIIARYAFHKHKEVQFAAGLVLPILPCIMAFFLNSRISRMFSGELDSEVSVLVFNGLALVYILIAAFYLYIPKFAFDFHAHHPLQTDTPIYTCMLSAAAVLLVNAGSEYFFAVTLGLCVLHFIISYAMKCNITAAGSAIAVIVLTHTVLGQHFDRDSNAAMYILFGLFVVLMAVSRFAFFDGIAVKKDGVIKIDVLLLSAWTAVIPMPFVNETAAFLRLMAIAIFAAGFIKKNTSSNTASLILSFSALFAAIAAMNRPFLNPDSSMISSKVTLAIMVLLGIAYRYIWRNHKEASKAVSTIVFVLSFAGLIIDGFIYDELANKIFVLGVTAAILIFSFYAKSKTWFTASSTALVTITSVYTVKYFNTAGWWAYLLAVGVIFIAIAAANEACRKKGETMKSTVAKKFSDWTW